MNLDNLKKHEYFLIALAIALLLAISLCSHYYGSTDVSDYADVTKYFAGDYNAKIRSSHSYLYGLVHSFAYRLFPSPIIFKLSSIFFLGLLCYSVYYFSGKNRASLILMVFSPIVWYMAPWANSIQISSFLFFLGYVLIKKYELKNDIRFLVFSGIFIGLSWAFWDAIIFFFILAAISFFYNRKSIHLALFCISVTAGLLPKLILDKYLFGLFYAGILRYFSGIIAAVLYGGVYGEMSSSLQIGVFILIMLFIPIYTYKLFSKKNWLENKSSLIFILLSLLLILKNSQIRYSLLIAPIIVYELSRNISWKEIRNQLMLSLIIITVVMVPYALQIKYSIQTEEFGSLIFHFNDLKLSDYNKEIIASDLNFLAKDYPNSSFLVGNNPDDYQILAGLYSGKAIREFVSIQDYELSLENSSVIFEKRISTKSSASERRQIWIGGGINKNSGDETDYRSIVYAIALDEPLNLDGFHIVKKYDYLTLYEKDIDIAELYSNAYILNQTSISWNSN